MIYLSSLIKSARKCPDAPEVFVTAQDTLIKEICFVSISTAMSPEVRKFEEVKRNYAYFTGKGISETSIRRIGSHFYAIAKEYDVIYPNFPVEIDNISATIDAVGKIGEEYHGIIIDIDNKSIDEYSIAEKWSIESDIIIGLLKKIIKCDRIFCRIVLPYIGISAIVPGSGDWLDVAVSIHQSKTRKRGSWCMSCPIGCIPKFIGKPLPKGKIMRQNREA